MKTRRMINNDYSFGSGPLDLITGRQAILQTCKTRLSQIAGEWFLNYTDGVRWGDILGHSIDTGQLIRVVKNKIESVEGVKSVTRLEAHAEGRSAFILATIETADGQITLNESINVMEALHDKADK